MRATQLSLFQDRHDEQAARLASVMQLVRAAMHRSAGGLNVSRDQLADSMTHLSRSAGVRLSAGNAKSVKSATLEKWLNPVDRDHPPSLVAVVAFCQATGDVSPLRPLLEAVGCEVMTEDDRKLRDYARAILEEKAARKRKKQLELEAGL